MPEDVASELDGEYEHFVAGLHIADSYRLLEPSTGVAATDADVCSLADPSMPERSAMFCVDLLREYAGPLMTSATRRVPTDWAGKLPRLLTISDNFFGGGVSCRSL
jgi:hypothetical protein